MTAIAARRRFALLAIVWVGVTGAFATAQAHAQDPSAIPPQLPAAHGDVHGDAAGCVASATAACRRKPRPGVSGVNATGDTAAPIMLESGGGTLRLQGDAQALRIEVRESTIADVLTAMSGAFDMHYRSSIELDEEISGTYAGSLTRVIARVLDGYDYAIMHESSALRVMIFGKSGERAVPGALPPATTKPVRRGNHPAIPTKSM